MEVSSSLLIALGILSLVAVAFFAVFRGQGKLSINSKLGKLTAEGQNPTNSPLVASGIKIRKAEVTGKIVAHSNSSGGIELDSIQSGDVEAIHSPGDCDPKA